LNEALSTVSNNQVKTVILDAVNDIINLKNLQNVVIASNRANSNNSGQQSISREQGQSDKNSIHGSGLDTGTESDVQFSHSRLGHESSTDSENTSQRTENLGRPKQERLSLLELLAEEKKDKVRSERIRPVSPFETTDTDIILRINNPVSFKYDIMTIHNKSAKYAMDKHVINIYGKNK